MATTRVHLVRHGQVDNPRRMVYGRQPGWRLSAKGRRQAEGLARDLSGRSVAAIYSSPLERAVETAEVIGSALGLPVLVREELTESALAAKWEGHSWLRVFTRHRREWETYRKRPLELDAPEPLRGLAERMGSAVRALSDAHRGEEIVIVSHGDPIKAAVCALIGGDLARLHDQPLPTGGRITLDVDERGAATIVEQAV
jgi:broad specificity phosphatase PhoE